MVVSREKALITPSILLWAREVQGLDIAAVAAKLKKTEAQIKAWENGEEQPSLAQARKLAALYRRPLAVFYLPEPPRDFQAPVLPDFRRLPDGLPKGFSPALRNLVRLAQLRQEWVREELQFEGKSRLRWVGSGTNKEESELLAARIRRWLNVSFDAIRSQNSNAEALRLWIDRVEERGAFVFQSGGPSSVRVEPVEARGFALLDPYAPIVMINGSDSEAGRMFTLIHEIVHLWIGEPGVSNLEPVRRVSTPNQRIEQFCNATAAEVLLPSQRFVDEWGNPDVRDTRTTIERISARRKVSREVVARRALDVRYINWQTYMTLRSEFMSTWRRSRERQRESEGGPNWWMMVPKRAGYAFTRMALGAFAEGRITGGHLVEVLNSKINRLPDIAAHADMPWSGWGPAA